jgi:hypothetical protein
MKIEVSEARYGACRHRGMEWLEGWVCVIQQDRSILRSTSRSTGGLAQPN